MISDKPRNYICTQNIYLYIYKMLFKSNKNTYFYILQGNKTLKENVWEN